MCEMDESFSSLDIIYILCATANNFSRSAIEVLMQRNENLDRISGTP